MRKTEGDGACVQVWETASEISPMRPGDLQVWQACLDVDEASTNGFRNVLSGEERARAERFVFERDRRRFVARRGILRSILGAYLGEPPGKLRFSLGPQGKPALEMQDGAREMRFSVSHSCGIALYAFAIGNEVGVDLERVRTVDSLGIAGRCFTGPEMDALKRLPEDQRTAFFFCCWTRKEALVKALGTGLSTPLDECEVAAMPRWPMVSCNSLSSPGKLEGGWLIVDLEPAPGYAASVVFRGGNVKCMLRTWAPAPVGAAGGGTRLRGIECREEGSRYEIA